MNYNQTRGYDFDSLKEQLLNQAAYIDWFPQGKKEGGEFRIGSLMGEPGQSLSINTQTGAWQDFATGERGTNLLDLYCAIHSIGTGEAAKRLGATKFSKKPGVTVNKKETNALKSNTPGSASTPACEEGEHTPSINTNPVGKPSIKHQKHGLPSAIYYYTKWFWMLRYDYKDENGANKKHLSARHWNGSKWIAKFPPAPRPLYNAVDIPEDKPILIVEGEKCVDWAIKNLPQYHAVTWSSGSKAWDKSDFKPIHGRNVLLWPDNDEPGISAMMQIRASISDYCPQIKMIDPSDMPNGWDIADWDGTTKELIQWAKSRVKVMDSADIHSANIQYEVLNPNEAPPPNIEVTLEQLDRLNLNDRWGLLGIKSNKSGPLLNELSIAKCLSRSPEFKGKFIYDDFYNKHFCLLNGEKEELEQRHIIDVAMRLQGPIYCLDKAPVDKIERVINYISYNNIVNEPKDWLKSLTWDGNERLPEFFPYYFDSEISEYTAAVGKNFFIAMVARIFEPGCKMDNMIVLQGHQGKGKSEALRAIAGDRWHVELGKNDRFGDYDFLVKLKGKMIVEAAELASFKHSGQEEIKQAITCRADEYRDKFAKNSSIKKRTCVFVGTTNMDRYLKDPTGARRFWPIAIKSVRLSDIIQDREQLFAEAVHRYNNGETWYEVPEDELKRVQEDVYEEHDWLTIISEWLEHEYHPKIEKALPGTKYYPLQGQYIAENALNMSIESLGRGNNYHFIRDIMTRLGYSYKCHRSGPYNIVYKQWVK